MPSDEHDAVLAMLQAERRNRNSPPTIEQRRAGLESLAEWFPLPQDIEREPVHISGVGALRLIPPEAIAGRTLVYLHGGGYVAGSSSSHAELAGRIGRAARTAVLVLDYPLAPEHRFPAAVDAVVEVCTELIRGPEVVALAGDSAGAGLAVAALVAGRGRGLPDPVALTCLSPWVDLTCNSSSMSANADADPVCDRAGLLEMADCYLDGADPTTSLASPLGADLRGLPPTLIQVGSIEVLLDDAVRLAATAAAAGVPVQLDVHEGLGHVWHSVPSLPESVLAVDDIGRFLDRRLTAA